MIFHVTFGQQFHREPHPVLPRVTPDGWMDVEADDATAAQSVVMDSIGGAWAMLYSDDDPDWKPEYFPAGCIGTIP